MKKIITLFLGITVLIGFSVAVNAKTLKSQIVLWLSIYIFGK